MPINYDAMESEAVDVQKVLNEQVLSPEVLIRHCSLDYGRHCGKTGGENTGLGILDKLATELQHEILSAIDVATLLTFRRVNHEAMTVVDGLVDFKKVGQAL